MIVKSSFRQAGGINAHLLRNDTNERVQVRLDLFRSAPLDLSLALRLMEGISRTNQRAKRDFIHVIISPAHSMDDHAANTAFAMIEREFGIAADAPRAVVQHYKGRRPAHFHAVYSIIDLTTGRAIKSNENYTKDELISRRLEIELGEPTIPGPRLLQNYETLRHRGALQEATLLEPLIELSDRNAVSRHDIRQAERLGVDLAATSKEIFDLYEAADRDLGAFVRLAAEHGFALSSGHTCIRVSKDENGFAAALGRLLRREGKAVGRSVDLKEKDLAAAYPRLQSYDDERDDGLVRARTKAARRVEAECQRGICEALIDCDMDAVTAFRAMQKRQQQELEQSDREQRATTLKARRAEIAGLYRKEDEVRRQRVDRAFRIARMLDTATMRRLAFSLAVAGALMTGAGLLAAVAAGVASQVAMPSLGRARSRAKKARIERGNARENRDRAMRQAGFKNRNRGTTIPQPTRFSFGQIEKADRVLAGYYATALLGETNAVDGKLIGSAKAALGADNVAGIVSMLERGSPLQIKRLLHWHRGIPEPGRHRAVKAALARHAGKLKDLRGRNAVKSKGVRRSREIER